jgi:hypothetical protein
MRTLSSAVLIAISAGFLGLSAHGVRGEPPAGAERFRILFEPGASALPVAGPEAAQNAAALKRIAGLYERLSNSRGVRFIFVAANPACASSQNCDAERLTFERLQQIKLAIGTAASPRKLHFTLQDEPGLNVTLPEAPSGKEELVLFLDQPQAGSSQACHAKILLRDPDLPPMLAGPGESFFLSDSEQARVGPKAQIAIAPEAGRTSYAVWGDGNGGLRKDARSSAGAFYPVPEGAAHLFLLSPDGENTGLTILLASIGDSFASSPWEAMLSRGNLSELSAPASRNTRGALLDPKVKGIGDDPRYVGDGTVKPKPGETASLTANAPIALCRFEFSAAPPLDEAMVGARAEAVPVR